MAFDCNRTGFDCNLLALDDNTACFQCNITAFDCNIATFDCSIAGFNCNMSGFACDLSCFVCSSSTFGRNRTTAGERQTASSCDLRGTGTGCVCGACPLSPAVHSAMPPQEHAAEGGDAGQRGGGFGDGGRQWAAQPGPREDGRQRTKNFLSRPTAVGVEQVEGAGVGGAGRRERLAPTIYGARAVPREGMARLRVVVTTPVASSRGRRRCRRRGRRAPPRLGGCGRRPVCRGGRR